MNFSISNDLTVLTFSGLVGMIHYWLFNQLNFLNFFDRSQSDEKIALITLMGLVNVLVYSFISLKELNVILMIIISFFLSLFIEFLILLIVDRVSEIIKKTFLINKSYKFHGSGLEEILESQPNTHVKAFIFDLKEDFIAQGYVSAYSEVVSIEGFYLSLKPFEDDEGDLKMLDTDFTDFRKETDEIYIDFHNRIKIYIVFEDRDD